MDKFKWPEGHKGKCKCSTGIGDETTFGRGLLDDNGYWAIPCYECARALEKQYPEMGKCWPFAK
jgi:hypothetical protein